MKVSSLGVSCSCPVHELWRCRGRVRVFSDTRAHGMSFCCLLRFAVWFTSTQISTRRNTGRDSGFRKSRLCCCRYHVQSLNSYPLQHSSQVWGKFLEARSIFNVFHGGAVPHQWNARITAPGWRRQGGRSRLGPLLERKNSMSHARNVSWHHQYTPRRSHPRLHSPSARRGPLVKWSPSRVHFRLQAPSM